jgi:hypothetical protein
LQTTTYIDSSFYGKFIIGGGICQYFIAAGRQSTTGLRQLLLTVLPQSW